MKRIAITMALCLAATFAYANTPTGAMNSGPADSNILPETNVNDGDGSGLGISEPAPGDVDTANMGETGASGAVGTATGTTGNPSMRKPMVRNKGKARRGMRAHTDTATSTTTGTDMTY